MRDVILPWALNGADLGDDVLEVGPGYGATTDVLSRAVPRLSSVEIDDELAAMLTDRFADMSTSRSSTATRPRSRMTTTGPPAPRVSRCCTTFRRDRLFGGVARVLRPGAPLVAGDSLGSEELKARLEYDTYNPVDPATLPDRLAAAGFSDVDVRTNDYGWAVIARVAG